MAHSQSKILNDLNNIVYHFEVFLPKANNTAETLSASPLDISSLADAQMQSFAKTLASHRTKRDEEFYN